MALFWTVMRYCLFVQVNVAYTWTVSVFTVHLLLPETVAFFVLETITLLFTVFFIVRHLREIIFTWPKYLL